VWLLTSALASTVHVVTVYNMAKWVSVECCPNLSNEDQTAARDNKLLAGFLFVERKHERFSWLLLLDNVQHTTLLIVLRSRHKLEYLYLHRRVIASKIIWNLDGKKKLLKCRNIIRHITFHLNKYIFIYYTFLYNFYYRRSLKYIKTYRLVYHMEMYLLRWNVMWNVMWHKPHFSTREPCSEMICIPVLSERS
jgi:hypothetical protein